MFENRESSSEVECLRKTNLRFPSELSNPPNLAYAMSPQLTQLKQMSPQHTQLNPISPLQLKNQQVQTQQIFIMTTSCLIEFNKWETTGP